MRSADKNLWRSALVFTVAAGILSGGSILGQDVSSDTGDKSDSDIPTVKISRDEAYNHHIGKYEEIRRGTERQLVGVRLTIGPDGMVEAAEATTGPTELFDQAIALAKTRRYQPFMRHGHPVRAIYEASVDVLPAEKRPEKYVPFPKIHDWKSLHILLLRTGGNGASPTYHVEIKGDGSVLYEGLSGVGVEGRHRGQISQKTLLELVETFRHADYFWLHDDYSPYGEEVVLDNSISVIALSFDGKRKQVTDNAGVMFGLPAAVTELEETIDRLAGTEKWVKGNSETI